MMQSIAQEAAAKGAAPRAAGIPKVLDWIWKYSLHIFNTNPPLATFIGIAAAAFFGIRHKNMLLTVIAYKPTNPNVWDNSEYMNILQSYVEQPELVYRYLLVYGPKGAGKSVGIIKAEYLWQQQPEKYFVIDINLKSSSITSASKLAQLFEQRVLQYLSLTKLSTGDIQQLAIQHGFSTRPKGEGLIKSIFQHITESHASVVRHILELLLQEHHKDTGDALTIIFLMDLLNLAASQSTVKPIVVFREIQLLHKWNVETFQTFVSSLEVIKEGRYVRMIIETSDYSYIITNLASHNTMQRCEVVGWHNPKHAVVEEAKWFTEDDFNVLEPLLGGTPGLWMDAKIYHTQGGSIPKVIVEMRSHYEIFLCNLSNDERGILQTLGSGWSMHCTDELNSEHLITNIHVRSLIEQNILYVTQEGRLTPENKFIEAVLESLKWTV